MELGGLCTVLCAAGSYDVFPVGGNNASKTVETCSSDTVSTKRSKSAVRNGASDAVVQWLSAQGVLVERLGTVWVRACGVVHSVTVCMICSPLNVHALITP